MSEYTRNIEKFAHYLSPELMKHMNHSQADNTKILNNIITKNKNRIPEIQKMSFLIILVIVAAIICVCLFNPKYILIILGFIIIFAILRILHYIGVSTKKSTKSAIVYPY